MATVKAVPGRKGVWEIRYDSEDPATGNRKQHKRLYKGTKPQAEKHAIDLQSSINKGEYNDLGDITVRDYFKKWEKEYCKPNLAFMTCQSYTGIIKNHILPFMGGVKLSNLKPANLQDYYTLMLKAKEQEDESVSDGKGLSCTSVLYHHRIIREALSHAVKLGYIHYNPADRVKPPRKNKPDMMILSIEQAQDVLETYKDHRAFLPILLAIKTGMRQGEICGLCWTDIDLKTGIISVTHALQRQGKELKFKEPKTKKSRRSIPIPKDVVEVLKAVQRQYKENKLSFGPGFDPRGFICAWEDGRPFEPDWVSKEWRRIKDDDKKRAKKEDRARYIPHGVRFHDLRHTHATILLSQGVGLKVVQERLGHESITTTGDIYAHVTPTMQQQAVSVLETVFTPKEQAN